MAPLISLGTCTLSIDPACAGPFAFRFDQLWTPFNAGFLDGGNWAPGEEGKIDILTRCLKDPSLDAECHLQRRAHIVVIRVAISSNDDGRWKPSSARSRVLKDLFGILDKDWNGGGDKVLMETVSFDVYHCELTVRVRSLAAACRACMRSSPRHPSRAFRQASFSATPKCSMPSQATTTPSV